MASIEEMSTRGGVIEGSARVLREVLRMPKVRRTVRTVLSNVDPENAPNLVDALMDDPDLLFDVVAASPTVVNVVGRATGALCGRLLDYPPKLLRDYVGQVAGKLEAEELGEAAGRCVALLLRLREGEGERGRERERFAAGMGRGMARALEGEGRGGGELVDAIIDGALSGARGIAGKIGPESVVPGTETARRVEVVTRGIRELGERHPDFVAGVVVPLIDAVAELRSYRGGVDVGGGDENAS